jgi:hypothetical protein
MQAGDAPPAPLFFDVTVVKGNTSLDWVLLYDKPPPRRLGWSQKRNQISSVDVGGCEGEFGV